MVGGFTAWNAHLHMQSASPTAEPAIDADSVAANKNAFIFDVRELH